MQSLTQTQAIGLFCNLHCVVVVMRWIFQAHRTLHHAHTCRLSSRDTSQSRLVHRWVVMDTLAKKSPRRIEQPFFHFFILAVPCSLSRPQAMSAEEQASRSATLWQPIDTVGGARADCRIILQTWIRRHPTSSPMTCTRISEERDKLYNDMLSSIYHSLYYLACTAIHNAECSSP